MTRLRRHAEVKVQFKSVLRADLAGYVRLKRSLGFDLRDQIYTLGKFDRLLTREMSTAGPITRAIVESFLRSLNGLSPLTRKRQLSIIRQFCLHLRQGEPVTFIPGRDLEPGRAAPRAPHIYSAEEIQRLLRGALDFHVRPRGSLRPKTYHCLFALLYAAGLRISEALAFNLDDLDVRQQLLHVRKTKFYKARLVPLAASTVAGLKRYLVLRAEKGHSTAPSAPFFVNDWGQRIPYDTAQPTFRRISRKCGLRGPAGTRGPRLHDLRHSFAVHRLLAWYREGKNVQALLPALATYLGHAHISGTQVYLHATEELLAVASDRYRQHFDLDHQPQEGVTP